MWQERQKIECRQGEISCRQETRDIEDDVTLAEDLDPYIVSPDGKHD